ncbi:MAG: DUF4350 domain-containing protein, partial [Candidatus Dormibacteraeota bacterium]|nr:DUF4350 domain-containing protein [Candidatus Dormibacteraeota bacterium]
MRPSARTWALVALVAATGLALLLRGSSSGDSPEHRTDSDAANGASVLPQLVSALGRQSTTLQDSFNLQNLNELFVLNPTQGFSRDQAHRLSSWVSRGGVLVYASPDGDPQLDATLSVQRQSLPISGFSTGAGPALAGVFEVDGSTTVRPLNPPAGGVPLLRGALDGVTAYEQLLGRGRLVVLADPLPLCNGYLEQYDNARLTSDLISLAPPNGVVGFDEYHHASLGIESPVSGVFSTSWGMGLGWAVAVVFAGLLLRGRRFGPQLQRPGPGHRSATEHVTAVGRLLAAARASGMTGGLLTAATRRVLASRYGLRTTGPGLDAALAARAPEQAQELARAEAELAANRGDAGLLAAARRLHRLAHPDPSPQERRQGEGTGGRDT